MRRNRVRLTESQLHRVIKESVNIVLNEIGDTAKGQYMLGCLAHRKGEGTDTKGRMRKDKETYPIFNYADKAQRKAKMYDGDFNIGRRHQRDLERFDASNDPQDYIRTAALHHIFKRLRGDRSHAGDPLFPMDANTPKEDARRVFDWEDDRYFPNK